MTNFLFFLLGGAIALILFEAVRLAYFARQARILARRTKLATYDHSSPIATILVLGDSVGCGTGASHPDYSIAGRLARQFSGVHLTNKSIVGGTGLEGLYSPLAQESGAYNIVILFIGGLDIIQFTNKSEYRQLLENIYREARRLGERVVHVSPANVGLAPIFRPPLAWIYTKRSREFRDIAQMVARAHEVRYVDMFYEKSEDPFQQQRHHYASDLSHPSDAGYGIWADRIALELSPLVHGNLHRK